MGVGYDNVDIAAAARMGIAVCNIPDYGKEKDAEERTKERIQGMREEQTQPRCVDCIASACRGTWNPVYSLLAGVYTKNGHFVPPSLPFASSFLAWTL